MYVYIYIYIYIYTPTFTYIQKNIYIYIGIFLQPLSSSNSLLSVLRQELRQLGEQCHLAPVTLDGHGGPTLESVRRLGDMGG